jgi:Caulimovirus viroplasmin
VAVRLTCVTIVRLYQPALYVPWPRPLHSSLYSIRWYTGEMPKAGYYAVKIGKRPGIYATWSHSTSFFLDAALLTI